MRLARHWIATAMFAVSLIAFPHSASAEELVKGSTEAVGYVGGLTDNLGATLGGGIGYAVTPRWLAVGELGLLTGQRNSDGVEFSANAHYLIPLREHYKLTPYLLGGLGIVRISSNTKGGVNLGGGLRWQAGPNWGVRPEIKFWVGDGTYAKFSIGMYYQFGRK